MANKNAVLTRQRTSFSRIETSLSIPNLIDVQRRSYERFLQMNLLPEERENHGLQAVFNGIFPFSDFRETCSLDFVRYSTDTQRLADQTKWISYGPVRKSSLPLVAPDMQPHMPTYPENFKTALQNDFEWWADHQDEMNERFAAWLAK